MNRAALTFSLGLAASAALGQAAPNPDRARGADIVGKLCVSCHGADGNSPLEVNPKLAGLQPEYLRKQLGDYKAKRRRSDIMETMVEALSESDIDSLAAHYSAQPPKPGVVRRPELLELGKKVYTDGNAITGVPSCSGCHYPDGGGTKRFPRLAGQHAEYTLRQLKDFKDAKRENDRGLVMQSVAVRMTDKEMEAVSEYIAGMK
jgi:cytochrome c553